MKTAEEYLKNKGLKNPSIDSGVSAGGMTPRVRVSDIMKEYANEVAKQALVNASKNAIIMQWNEGYGSTYKVDKRTIIDKNNIPNLD